MRECQDCGSEDFDEDMDCRFCANARRLDEIAETVTAAEVARHFATKCAHYTTEATRCMQDGDIENASSLQDIADAYNKIGTEVMDAAALIAAQVKL